MSNYFDQFPIINYNGIQVRDLSRRNRLLPVSLSNPYLFLPYTITDEDRAEDIAYYYYGSTEYTWLVLLANSIIDPYHDWPLKEEDFHKYLIKKYEQQSGKKGYEIVDWAKNETLEENIAYYSKPILHGDKNVLDRLILNPDSFKTLYLRREDSVILLTEKGSRIIVKKIVPEEWTATRIYDYEFETNENKRNIVLVDKQYLPIIEKDLKRLLKE